MKHINYGSEPIHTDDEIADLVLEYAKRLAVSEASDNITIPYRTEAGDEAHITLLLGPASQITAASDLGGVTALTMDTARAKAELRARIRRLDPAQVVFDTDEQPAAEVFELLDGTAAIGDERA